MKRFAFLAAFFSLTTPLKLFTQITFNKLIYFDFPVVSFSGVIATDSCYYIKSTYTDSIPPHSLGLMMSKFNNQGNLINSTTIYSSNKIYDGIYCNLESTDNGNMVQVASVGDTIVRAILLKHNLAIDTIFTKEFFSPLYPSLEYLVPRAIRQRPDKGFAILFGHESIAGQDFDVSLLVLDSACEIQHYKVLGSTPQQETATALILDGDGGYVVGTSRTNVNQVDHNFTSRALVIKTDSTGEPVWQWLSPQGELWGEAEQLARTADGGLVVASKKGKEVLTNAGVGIIYWDANVFKLDADRNLAWSTPLRGSRPSQSTGLTEMVEAPNGSGYVVSGQAIDSLSGPELKFGTWLAKVSPTGDSLWARYFTWHEGELWAPEPWGMAATPDGGYVVVGMTQKLGLPVPGWVLKVDSFGCLVPGCHLMDAAIPTQKPITRLSVYPNPATDLLNCYVSGPAGLEGHDLRICNANGQTMTTQTGIQFNTTLIFTVVNWPPGNYFIQCLKDGAVMFTEKFIKI